MANTSSSANMSLPIPVVGTQSGPQYAININDCLTIIDQHTHTPGSGVPITSAALNINADLSIGGNNLTSVKSVRMSPQSTTLVGASDLGCIYEVNDDLYYNDANGTAIRITQNGAVAGTPGSIANLASPASASYVSASSKFVFQSDVNTPAYIDVASILIRNLTASSNALTLEAPAAMGADFTITLPRLPASKKIMTLTSAGAMNADYDVDGSTLEVASNNIRVKASGIGTTQLADGSVTAPKLGVNLTTTTFTSNGNWTCPTNVTQVILQGCGGGGGGASSGTGGAGGGGGGVSLNTLVVAVTPGVIYPITIGAGGAGGAAPGSNPINGGSSGGTTSFGGLAAFGGAAGAPSTGVGGLGQINGGAAAAVGGTNYGIGYSGGAAGTASGGGFNGGGGGAAGYGNGGKGGNANNAGVGQAGAVGSGYGSGGGGGGSALPNTAGGAGAPGILMITYLG
jgi:hypothetical protein